MGWEIGKDFEKEKEMGLEKKKEMGWEIGKDFEKKKDKDMGKAMVLEME